MPLLPGSPKRLEKMLFINHKEDLMLNDKLADLKLRSRLKVMELDRERIRVRNELRNSRKKNITVSEAMASGLIPTNENGFGASDEMLGRRQSMFPQTNSASRSPSADMSRKRSVASAPQRRKDGPAGHPPAFSRGVSLVQPSHKRTITSSNQFSRRPTFAADEYKNGRYFNDSVGAYVINEFEKISQVVPDILRALAKKKAQIEEENEIKRMAAETQDRNESRPKSTVLLDYEPDMNKVRKTVSSVKKLRHRMSISKKLETSKPHKSLSQMIKERTENVGEYDEYTDGTCALMKRRLEKKRRDSAPVILEESSFPRRHSTFSSSMSLSSPLSRRPSLHPGLDSLPRRSSMLQLPTPLSRSATTIGLGSTPRVNSNATGMDGESGTQMLDEDFLVNRQRVLREMENYEMLQVRVDQFMLKSRRGMNRVSEEIIPLSAHV